MIREQEILDQQLSNKLLDKIENNILERLQKGEEVLNYHSEKAHRKDIIVGSLYEIAFKQYEQTSYIIQIVRQRVPVPKFWRSEHYFKYSILYFRFKNYRGDSKLILTIEDNPRIEKIYKSVSVIYENRRFMEREQAAADLEKQLQEEYNQKLEELEKI